MNFTHKLCVQNIYLRKWQRDDLQDVTFRSLTWRCFKSLQFFFHPSIHPWGSLAPFSFDLDELSNTCLCNLPSRRWIARVSSREMRRESGDVRKAPCFPRWNSRNEAREGGPGIPCCIIHGLRVPRYRVIILYPDFRATFVVEGGKGDVGAPPRARPALFPY